MSLTRAEIHATLILRYDAEDLCDLLEISSDELLDHLDYKIDENWDKIVEELEDV